MYVEDAVAFNYPEPRLLMKSLAYRGSVLSHVEPASRNEEPGFPPFTESILPDTFASRTDAAVSSFGQVMCQGHAQEDSFITACPST